MDKPEGHSVREAAAQSGDIDLRVPVTRARLRLDFAKTVSLAEQPVITLRGLLGYALLDHFHGSRHEPPSDSPYWQMFKPPQRIPHPFIIACPSGAGHASTLTFSLCFFGTGRHWLADCLAAFELGKQDGFGPGKTSYQVTLEHVAEEVKPDIGQALEGFRLILATPAQLLWRGQPLQPEGPVLHTLVWAAVRRLQALTENYGGACNVPAEAVEAAITGAEITRVSLTHVSGARSSSFSRASISTGGIQGWLELRGAPLLYQLFSAAACCGIGKKTFAGNGRLRVASLDEVL